MQSRLIKSISLATLVLKFSISFFANFNNNLKVFNNFIKAKLKQLACSGNKT